MYLPPQEKKEFKLVSEGTHLGVLVRIADLGSHWSDKWEKFERKVDLAWEIPAELADNGKPLLVSNRYTLSAHEKGNLAKLVRTWTGRNVAVAGIDFTALLAQAGLVAVQHSEYDGKQYANVDGVSKLMAGMTAPKPAHEPVLFDLDSFSQGAFDALPQYLRDQIVTSEEYKRLSGQAAPSPASWPQDDVPPWVDDATPLPSFKY